LDRALENGTLIELREANRELGSGWTNIGYVQVPSTERGGRGPQRQVRGATVAGTYATHLWLQQSVPWIVNVHAALRFLDEARARHDPQRAQRALSPIIARGAGRQRVRWMQHRRKLRCLTIV